MCLAGPFLLAIGVLWPPDHMHSLAGGHGIISHCPARLDGTLGPGGRLGSQESLPHSTGSELSPGEPEPWEVCASQDGRWRWPGGGGKASWVQPRIPETSEQVLPGAGIQGCHRPGGIWGAGGLLPPKKAHTSVSPVLGCI